MGELKAKMDYNIVGFCNCGESNSKRCPGIMKRRYSDTLSDQRLLNPIDYAEAVYGSSRSLKCTYCGVLISSSVELTPENSPCDKSICTTCGKRRSHYF